MRKRIITLILSMLVVGFTQAQVIFDPANYVDETLPSGMSIVDIGGTKYLKTVLNGWNSTIQVSPTAVQVTSGNTSFKFKAKYASDTAALDKIKLFVQPFNAAGEAVGASDATPSVDFTTYSANFSKQAQLISMLQLAGQYKGGSWPALVGDTLWISKITAYDPTAVVADSVLFDPATLEEVPAGTEIVEEGGKKYLKVKVNEWNANFAIPAVTVGSNYNKFKFEAKYEQATAPTAPADARVFVQAMGASSGLFSAEQKPGSTTFAQVVGDAIAGVDVVGLQVAVQDMANGWAAISDAYVYVGKMILFKQELPKATPPETAVLNYTTKSIVIDDQYDDAFEDAADVTTINKVSLGTVNGTAAAEGATVNMNADSYAEVWMIADLKYLYLYAEVSDNDVIDIGESTSPWFNDGMEIFVDINDGRYVGQNRIDGMQHQLRVNFNESGAGKISGYQHPTTNDTIAIKSYVVKGSTSYSMEVAIPWALIYRNNINTNAQALALVSDPVKGLKTGKNIAVELSLIDAEALDTRKSILNWSNPTGEDMAYTSPEYWGQVTLAGFPGGGSSVAGNEVTKFNVYPNPTTGELYLDLANVAKVEIYNVLGAKVQSVNLVDNKVDVSALSMGVYVVKATTVNGEVAVSKFNKK